MKKVIFSEKAPAAIGPYSHGTSGAGLVFVSGQLGLDPATGQFVSDKTDEQTKQALENLKSVLEAAGCSLEDVLKVTIFIKNMDEFPVINQVYSGFFSQGNYPARCVVEVSRLPKDALVEIEAIALVKS